VALPEAEKLNIESIHFYFLLLAELYKSTDKTKASYYFQKAHSLAKTQTEKQNIQQKIDNLL
jgi:RNA polymerase sigma-70 factor (ECF subfamily)